MFFIPIVAGWALGLTTAKLVDSGRQRFFIKAKAPPIKVRVVKRSRLRAGIDAVQKLKREKIDGYIEDSYTQSQKEFSLEEQELRNEEELANNMLSSSSMLLGSIMLSSWICPPLMYLHIPPMLYISLPFYKQGVKDLFQKRKVTFMAVDTIWAILAIPYSLVNSHVLVYSAAVGWFFAVINKITIKTKHDTQQELSNLFGEQPKYVWLLKDDANGSPKACPEERGIEVEVPLASVQAGDIVVVNAGQMIPVDGTIDDGLASIDQHMLTGESQPAEKGKPDTVFAGTVVLSGKIYIQVEKTGVETAAAQISQILIQTSSYTQALQLRGKEIGDRAGLPTLTVGAVALLLFGAEEALAILYAGVGRKMQVFGPLSVLSYLQLTARQGILIKDGRALEQMSKVDTIVFDKTGTLTLEQPHVGTIHTCNEYTEAYLLTVAAAAEERQSHPIAHAIREEAEKHQLDVPSIGEASYEVGYGIKVRLSQTLIRVGSNRFMAMESITIPEEIEQVAQEAHKCGHSLVYVAIDDQLGGAIELVPTVRPEAKRVINNLRQLGLDMAIISGDHERPTRALAEELGISQYLAETLPEHKADYIAKLQEEGKFVCFVGDGINDAIALKKAQVGISLRGASTIATDTAQIILMGQSLKQLEELFAISQQFESNMNINIAATVLPALIVIAGAFTGQIGMTGSMLITFIGLGAGVGNGIRPLLTVSANQEPKICAQPPVKREKSEEDK